MCELIFFLIKDKKGWVYFAHHFKESLVEVI